MKRILALLLIVSTLFSLLACASDLTEETETGEASVTAEETENKDLALKEIPEICDKLTLEKINAFPVAKESMTPEEARELCVSFFRFCQTFAWTPNKTMTFVRNAKGSKTTVQAGTIYGGLPYGGVSSGNVYRLLDYLDQETGVVDIEKAAPNADVSLFANQCSMGAFVGWGRAINSADYDWTSGMVQKNGFIPVGDYKYDANLSSFSQKGTDEIVKENGQNVMFESYAKMKPADGLVEYGTAGHVIMCSSEPVVVRNADKTINGEESYFTVIDQGQAYKEKKQTDGTPFLVQGGVDRKVTFAGAFESSYLPFTFAEFLGQDPIDTPKVECTVKGDSCTADELTKAHLSSNYAIFDVYIDFINEKGEVVVPRVSRSKTVDVYEANINSFVMGSVIENYAKKGYSVRISVQTAAGPRLIAFEGKLLP